MIANNDKDQAFQQSIVVAITNKCRTVTKQAPCECATKELKRLKSMY